MEPAFSIKPQPWMTQHQTVSVLDALHSGSQPARFVGGCVRDSILGKPVKDYDIATPELPKRIIQLTEKAGLRAIPTGIEHGTITVVSGGIAFEITTLREDVKTFGRHAEVVFTEDWEKDAARRDLTLNALYCDADGTVYDPINGLPDLQKGLIKFIGDPRVRIAEDVLRILRYFRFFAYYGKLPGDRNSLSACGDFSIQLGKLSANRVWREFSKILAAPDPTHTMKLMSQVGVLENILFSKIQLDCLESLIFSEKKYAKINPDSIRRLVAMTHLDEPSVKSLSKRLNLPGFDRNRLMGLATPAVLPDVESDDKENRKILFQLGENIFRDLVLLGSASSPQFDWSKLMSLPDRLPIPPFPISGKDLIQHGIPEGQEIGKILETVKIWWANGGFSSDREMCLKKIKELVG